MTEQMIFKALQTRLDDQGITWARMESVEFVKEERRLKAVIDLEGEDEMVEVGATYEIADDAVKIGGVEASRPWIAGALTMVLEAKGASIPLPGGMQGTMIKMVL